MNAEASVRTTPKQAMPFQLSLGLRATADQQVARFHRESDRRRLRAMAISVVGAGLLVALVLSVVGLKVQQVRLSYRLDALRTTPLQFDVVGEGAGRGGECHAVLEQPGQDYQHRVSDDKSNQDTE